MDESKASPRKVKVVDKRKFTTDGEPLVQTADASATDHGQKPAVDLPPIIAEPSQPNQPKSADRDRVPAPATTSPEFLELVAMLAHQAEVLLLGAEDIPAQPAEAQRVINYLGALEEKTKGNLSADEAQILQNLVFQLRTIFLQNSTQ